MCVICGCGQADHEHAHEHAHGHGHGHAHAHSHTHDHAPPLGAVHAPGMDAARAIRLEEDILAENNRFATANRAAFAAHKVLALNLLSSPGSGKTTLLVRTLKEKRFPSAVVEGDPATDLDAARLHEAGARAVQINTGRGCHLDAHMVGHALDDLGLLGGALSHGVAFIENVGNLVCPAAFDLGEAAKIVLLSVTEGDDKPLKYPEMFRAAQLMVLTKSDLLPHVPFSVERCIDAARRVNPEIETLTLSAATGEGMESWFGWIEAARRKPAA